MKRFASLMLAVTILATVPTAAAGQERAPAPDHAASADILSAMAYRATTDREADEARVEALLSRPEVAEAADAAGLDIELLKTASQTLGDDDLRRVAARAAETEAMLAQADQVVISTTAIIIGLLILILILVA